MRRRQFIALLGGGAVVWPLAARAAAGRPRIGVLSISSSDSDAPNVAAFRDGLQRLGYVEGRSIDIDYRASNGDMKALVTLAHELVDLKPQVVLATAISPVRAVKRIAPDLPIVCVGFSDAFVPDLASNFAHPAGSVTGIATNVEGMFGKLVELTRDAIPGTTRIGFLSNPAGASTAHNEQQLKSATKAQGVELRIAVVEKPDDIDRAMRQLSDDKVQAVIVPGNGLLNRAQKRIVALAMGLRLPLIFNTRTGVMAGGLASYGVNIADNYALAAAYVDKILKGAAPGNLPIEFPTQIELVINLKTAKTLGLPVPQPLLDRANEVIE
jgi:putative ABC transport system substrate-binding protein